MARGQLVAVWCAIGKRLVFGNGSVITAEKANIVRFIWCAAITFNVSLKGFNALYVARFGHSSN